MIGMCLNQISARASSPDSSAARAITRRLLSRETSEDRSVLRADKLEEFIHFMKSEITKVLGNDV